MTSIMTLAVAKAGLVEFRLEFFIQVFNILVLFFFLRWLLFKPVTEFMDKRREKIQASLDDADSKVEEATLLKASYQDKLTNIRDEELEILKHARISAEERTAEMIKNAEEEIETMKIKARDDIEREREKAILKLKDDIANLALMAATKVVDKEIDGAKHVALIDDVIQKVGDAKWHN